LREDSASNRASLDDVRARYNGSSDATSGSSRSFHGLAVTTGTRVHSRERERERERERRREYSPRRAREIAESALCFHEHPVLPQTSRTRAETGLGALSKSSTRDLRSVKRRPSAAVQLPCNIVLPPCTLPTNWSSLGLVYFQQRHWNRFSRRRAAAMRQDQSG